MYNNSASAAHALSHSGDGVVVGFVLARTRADGVGLNVERHGSVGAEPPTASSEQHPCTVGDIMTERQLVLVPLPLWLLRTQLVEQRGVMGVIPCKWC